MGKVKELCCRCGQETGWIRKGNLPEGWYPLCKSCAEIEKKIITDDRRD